MTEFHIIGLGNLCEFVIKNIDEKQTYGTFSACDKHDRKSMQEFVDYVNQLIKEKEKLKERIKALQKESYGNLDGLNYYQEENASLSEKISDLDCEIEQLKEELNKLKKFEHGGEHIRLSINIETGELQRHIYATGQWFGDFDRVLVDNWLSKEDYQRFINRVIEVYNTEFKKELGE